MIIALTPSNFTEAKQILDCLFKNLDIRYSLEEAETSFTIEGRTGRIRLNNTPIGYIGEVHPETLKDWNLKLPLTIIELSLEEVFESISRD